METNLKTDCPYRRLVVLLYRSMLLLLGIVGLVFQYIGDGIGMLMYYTNLSNILVVLFLICLLAHKGKESVKLLRVKGGVTMSILITFVVYHLMLAPTAKPEDFYTIENYLLHYVVPLGFLLDTLVFDRVKYHVLDPIRWAQLPIVYFAFAILNGTVLHWPIPGVEAFYPYFFINVDKYGWILVLRNAALITAAYIAVGYVLFTVITLLSRKTLSPGHCPFRKGQC